MKTQNILTITVLLLSIALVSSCGSSNTNQITQSSTAIEIGSAQTLASCSRTNSDTLSLNIASVKDSSTGQINSNWVKVKFNYLSSNITQTGYSIRFYKWRVLGSNAQLDSNPLYVSSYSLSTGQTSSEMIAGLFTTQITKQSGYFIRLEDDAVNPYQVLKVVIYKTDGTVAAQSDVLIPQFAASPIDYKKNADGTIRAENLQKLHPLYGVDTSAWSQIQLKQNFEQHCF